MEGGRSFPSCPINVIIRQREASLACAVTPPMQWRHHPPARRGVRRRWDERIACVRAEDNRIPDWIKLDARTEIKGGERLPLPYLRLSSHLTLQLTPPPPTSACCMNLDCRPNRPLPLALIKPICSPDGKSEGTVPATPSPPHTITGSWSG